MKTNSASFHGELNSAEKINLLHSSSQQAKRFFGRCGIKILFITCFIFLSAIFILPQLALANTSQSNLALPTGTGLPQSDVKTILTNVMNWLLGIVGIIGIIGFIVSGILYFVSAGDDTRMKTAKQAMFYSIIGVVVALSGYVIITAINTMLSGTNSTF